VQGNIRYTAAPKEIKAPSPKSVAWEVVGCQGCGAWIWRNRGGRLIYRHISVTIATSACAPDTSGPCLIALDTPNPALAINIPFGFLVLLRAGQRISTYLHVRHPPLDFGAPFLGINERVIVPIGASP
jgi:hypothetical protein